MVFARKEVVDVAEAMEKKLSQREYLGNWRDESVKDLVDGLNAEIHELIETLLFQMGKEGNVTRIEFTDESQGEIIDCLNYLMFLWDKANGAPKGV
jgi:hypothetical protein